MTSKESDVSEGVASCPFCGAEAGGKKGGPQFMVSDSRQGWVVRCTACLARSVASFTKSRAAERWNTRVSPPLPSPDQGDVA